MIDREKIIKGLHGARRYLEDKEWSDRGASPHIDAINDALELLKAQRETIDELISADKLLKEQEEQIRQLTEELEELRKKRNEVYYSGYDGSFIMEV
jgi:chromosome segregation ATPase